MKNSSLHNVSKKMKSFLPHNFIAHSLNQYAVYKFRMAHERTAKLFENNKFLTTKSLASLFIARLLELTGCGGLFFTKLPLNFTIFSFYKNKFSKIHLPFYLYFFFSSLFSYALRKTFFRWFFLSFCDKNVLSHDKVVKEASTTICLHYQSFIELGKRNYKLINIFSIFFFPFGYF